MVQMKVKAGTQIQAIKSELYIPHGSDESDL